MTKARTIEAIEAGATEVFCRDGYDGASLREIARHAGVPLGAIHEYFESKSALYIRVAQRLFDALEQERQDLLRDLRSSQPALDLDAVIYCLVAPILAPAEADSRAAWTPSRLSAWYNTTEHLAGHPDFRDQLRRATDAWVRLLCEAEPGLSFENALLAYATTHSALLNWDATMRYLADTLGMCSRPQPREACAHFVHMMTAGIRTLKSSV